MPNQVMQFCLFDDPLREKAYDLLHHYLGKGGEPEVMRQCQRLLALQAHTGREEAYYSFTRPKSDGGRRLILAPYEPIMSFSRVIKLELLDRWPVGPSVHGFRTRRSTVSNALAHLNSGAMFALNMDVKDCFPSTSMDMVYRVLNEIVGNRMRKAGATADVSNMAMQVLAEIMTLRYGRVKDIPALPMGTPASPSMLNHVFRQFDERLLKALSEITEVTGQQFTYTRFGDDITVSSPDPLPRKIKQIITDLLYLLGYKPNIAKTKWMECGGSTWPIEVTGVIVSTKTGRLLLKEEWLKKTERELLDFIYHPHGSEQHREALANKIRGKLARCLGVYNRQFPTRIGHELTKLNNNPDPLIRERLWELSGRKRKKTDGPLVIVGSLDEIEAADEEFADEYLAEKDGYLDGLDSPFPY